MHVGTSVLLEARSPHVSSAMNERNVVVMHAHQLTLELKVDRTRQRHHVVAINYFKSEPDGTI